MGKATELKKMNLIFIGYEFSHYTNCGNAVWRLVFRSAEEQFFEFYTRSGGALGYRSTTLKNGIWYLVEWKYYGNTRKRIVYEVTPIPF